MFEAFIAMLVITVVLTVVLGVIAKILFGNSAG
jgi:Tfp pilus assembly protein PilV